jgi:hypothetical protein
MAYGLKHTITPTADCQIDDLSLKNTEFTQFTSGGILVFIKIRMRFGRKIENKNRKGIFLTMFMILNSQL